MKPVRFLFASDSFKGSLSTKECARLLKKAAEEVFPGCETDAIPVADGGEGTVKAVIEATGGRLIPCRVSGPLGDPVEAFYGQVDDRCAVIEMAAASGLPLLTEERRNPLLTSSYGTGELIRHATDNGFRELYIAIGGSATNDGGMGCMRALGVRFLDKDGKELPGCGEDLGRVREIDTSGLDQRLSDTNITVICDVNNPLCGENGATYTFGGQKGAGAKMLKILEEGMINYCNVIKTSFGVDPDTIPGSGAAGGLGCALMVFLKGTRKSGIDAVLDIVSFDKKLENTDLVITGEGCTDWQSCFGKVMQGVGMRAHAKNIPVVGLSGSLGKGGIQILEHGISSLMTSTDRPMTLNEAMQHAEELYYSAAIRMFRMIRVGMDIAEK